MFSVLHTCETLGTSRPFAPWSRGNGDAFVQLSMRFESRQDFISISMYCHIEFFVLSEISIVCGRFGLLLWFTLIQQCFLVYSYFPFSFFSSKTFLSLTGFSLFFLA